MANLLEAKSGELGDYVIFGVQDEEGTNCSLLVPVCDAGIRTVWLLQLQINQLLNPVDTPVHKASFGIVLRIRVDDESGSFAQLSQPSTGISGIWHMGRRSFSQGDLRHGFGEVAGYI